jgi:ribose-phosphate pyrophosphokinase
MASERLKKSAITELITTDSVPQKEAIGYKKTVLSVAELLGEAIKRTHKGESVTSLFELNGGSKKG